MTKDVINSGGPAFPNVSIKTEHGIEVWGDSGMTLRDYFAAKALPSIYSTAMADAANESGLFSHPKWRLALALDAYIMADAMLEAREKQ